MQGMRSWLAPLGVVMVAGLLLPPGARADVNLHGFVQGNYAVNTNSANPDGDSYKWAEERLQLKLDATQDALQLFVKADAWHDHLADKADDELREGYLNYAASSWDARVGRQVLTWGVGDLVFINDVFPKDYEAFFSGRPLEYLKKGIDGLRLGAYPDFASLELVLIPFFEPNHYPESGRFWQFDPLPGVTEATTREPDEALGNGEIAVRAYRRIADFDAALYAYRGHSRQPAMAPDSLAASRSLTFTYPELGVYGASLQGSAMNGVVSLETGYYDSLDDQDGADPMLPNSQLRFLVGYQKQLWEEGTLGLQYYAEIMQEYDAYTETMPPGFPREREVHGYVSLRFTQFFRNQTLKFFWFSFYSPDENDFLLNPEITYHFTDHVWAAVGALVFGGGDDWSRFGQFKENDHGYLQVRYEW